MLTLPLTRRALLGQCALLAQTPDTTSFLTQLKQAHQPWLTSISMQVEVARTVTRGDLSNRTNRTYHVISHNGEFQVRLLSGKDTLARVIFPNGRLLWLTTSARLYAESSSDSPEADSFLARMTELRHRFIKRLTDLDPAYFTAVRFLRDETQSINGQRTPLRRLELKAKFETLTLSLHPTTLLVWRSFLRSATASGELVEEQITWLSQHTDPAQITRDATLPDYSGFTRATTFTDRLPY